MAVSTGISDELICSICLDTFNTPVLLPCAHTFCKQCLINVHDRGRIRRQVSTQSNSSSTSAVGTPFREDMLVCPHCRLEIKLGSDGIGGLPRNTSLANIILTLEEEKRAKNILCEVCDYEPARAASKNCADCSVTYCLVCFRQLHPMRGAFKYHVIKEVYVPVVRCLSPISPEMRTRFTPSRDGYGTDCSESGDEGGQNQKDQLEKIRRQVKSKRKELNSVMKSVQNLLKTTEDDTEERMREIRSVCNQINESVGEKEATLLTVISQQRHEAVKQCLSLSSEVKAQTLSLDLLEDQINDIVSVKAVHSGTDVSNDVTALQERLSTIQSRSLIMRAKMIPRQPKLGEVEVMKYVATLDFVKDNKLLSPVLTEILHRPVSMGPAIVEIKWRAMDNVSKIVLSAKIKDLKGYEVTTSVELAGSITSYLMALPWSDAEYYIILDATTEGGAKYPPLSRAIRTLPYVHCFKARFNPATCHKKIAVSFAKDEIVHRKCKLANLQNSCVITTSFQRLESLEGAVGDECIPVLPYVYWESVVHFQVFGKLGNSKLICDIGICKQGCEDTSPLLCDNCKSYCAYLVKRNNRIALEFWNGHNRDTLPRSIPVLDLDNETEKTVKLGFYFDAMKRLFAIISPGNNAILSQFHVKLGAIVPVCGLYSWEHVYAIVKFTEPQKLPQVLCKLMKGNIGNQS